jgi:hypothetical protein
MNPTRKTITLPSGATVLIRKMKGRDFFELGEAPRDIEKRTAESPPLKAHELAWLVESNNLILTKCTGPICYPDGTKRTIVNKPFAQTSEAELSIEELDDVDGEAIIAAVTAFSDEGREAGREALKFPNEQALAANAGSPGRALQPASE